VQEHVSRVGRSRPSDGRRSRNGIGAFGIGQWLGSPHRGILGNTDFDAQISHVTHGGRMTEARAWAASRDAKTVAEGSRRQHV
jgi:hypothetical protein